MERSGKRSLYESMPLNQMIEGIDNNIFLQHIYSRLSSRDRAISSCVNKDWAEVYIELCRNRTFAEFVICGRKLCSLPRPPSLIMFQPYCSPCFPHQFWFEPNRATTGTRQLTDLNVWARHTLHSWSSVGKTIIATRLVGDGIEGYVGRLEEFSNSWRWIRTEPPPPGPDLPYRPSTLEVSFCTSVIIASHLVVVMKSYVLSPPQNLMFGKGWYCDLHSNSNSNSYQWSNLKTLFKPNDVSGEGYLLDTAHAFQWKSQLFVLASYNNLCAGRHRPQRRYACSYNFQTRSWNPWNGTPELRMLVNALSDISRRQSFVNLEFVEASDATLFVLGRTLGGESIVCFLRLDENAIGGFEWVNVSLPALGPGYQQVFQTEIWPLETYGCIAIVSVPHYRRDELVWWFLNRCGVYARGVFRLNTKLYSETLLALIHTDM